MLIQQKVVDVQLGVVHMPLHRLLGEPFSREPLAEAIQQLRIVLHNPFARPIVLPDSSSDIVCPLHACGNVASMSGMPVRKIASCWGR